MNKWKKEENEVLESIFSNYRWSTYSTTPWPIASCFARTNRCCYLWKVVCNENKNSIQRGPPKSKEELEEEAEEELEEEEEEETVKSPSKRPRPCSFSSLSSSSSSSSSSYEKLLVTIRRSHLTEEELSFIHIFSGLTQASAAWQQKNHQLELQETITLPNEASNPQLWCFEIKEGLEATFVPFMKDQTEEQQI
ncbi:hypothetical protein QOT17_024568, partial [Balamuthia mandrillaris]